MKKTVDRPIIFLGTGRCGTTVVSEIIMRHPDIAYPSNYQIRFPFFTKINLIRYLFENKLWSFKGQKKQLNKVNPLNKILFYPVENYKWWGLITKSEVDMSRDFLLKKEVGPETKKYLENYFAKLVKYQGRKRLSLKITGPSRVMFLKNIFPDAIFINVERDDFSTIKSFLNVPFWKSRGRDQIWWKGVYSRAEKRKIEENKNNPIYLTAFQIKKLKQVTQYELNTTNSIFLNVKYEDFIRNPKKEILKIMGFCDLKNGSDKCFAYLKNLKIINRNQANDIFFSSKDLKMIENIELDNLRY